ncbi:MAG: ABC transporter ATP-binding protein [Cellvibrio sp.]|uniref:ABC transporter ATP-binding protein n=1 Tax=Cellvibrio sp. TaxID=1965322 RepID=UPI002720A49D|nr:ABC transporter ATP-binding protein [Cellvibrio sp.]
MDIVIEFRNIKKVFQASEVETTAINDANIAICRGDYVAISGPSGSGKSTMLSIMGLLDAPSGGEYMLEKKATSSLKKSELARLRNRHIGFIFQSFNLIDSYSVIDNVKLPLIYRKELSRAEIDRKAMEALEKVGMSHRAKHYPAQLSGGQQQRVAIARAIVTDPSILLADEPTGNLDTSNAGKVMQILKDQHNSGCTICIVTHEQKYADEASRKIEIIDGKITEK